MFIRYATDDNSFFFKQKTAYEIEASDWSSDVCSSDLSYSDDESLPGECSWCHDDRGLYDRCAHLDEDRCFSIKLEETFNVETVRNNDKCFFRN